MQALGENMRTYKYETIHPTGSGDGTYNVPESINNAGDIVGYYQDSNSQNHGFLLDHGIYTTIDPPGSISTVATSINASGQIVGRYGTGSANLGFLYDHGTYTTIAAPGNSATDPYSINAKGQVVGVYSDGA